MSNIKVTVEYESPPEDKFAALMAEYKAAKAVADEAKTTIQPLIDAGMEAKYEAVCEQLKIFGVKLSEAVWRNDRYQPIGGYFGFSADAGYNAHDCEIRVGVTAEQDRECSYHYGGTDIFSPNAVQDPEIKCLLQKWNQYRIMEDLYQKLEDAWKREIKLMQKVPEDLRKKLTLVQEG